MNLYRLLNRKDIFELKYEIKLLHDQNEKGKLDAWEKDEVKLLALAVEFLVEKNNLLEIISKHDLVDLILEHNSILHQ